MTTYVFRDFSTTAVSAQVAGEELDRISKKYGGLVPSVVVRESESPDAPLYPCFERDPETGLTLWNEHLARRLIRSVRVVQESGTTKPAYVNVVISPPTADGPRRIYRPLLEAAKNKTEFGSAVALLTQKLVAAKAALEEVMEVIGESDDRDAALIAGIAEALATARALAMSLPQAA